MFGHGKVIGQHVYEPGSIWMKYKPHKLHFFFLCLPAQEKNFLQMVTEAGTPGIQKQIVKPQNLKGMEARYEHALQELADAVKVPTQTIQKRRDRSMKVPLTPRGNCVYSNNNLLLSPQEEKH